MVGKNTIQILHVTWQDIQPLYFYSHFFLFWVTCVCPGPFPVTNYGWHRLESNWGRRSVAWTVGGRSVVSKIKFVTHKQFSCDPTVHCACYWLTGAVWSPGDGLSPVQTQDTNLQLWAIITQMEIIQNGSALFYQSVSSVVNCLFNVPQFN